MRDAYAPRVMGPAVEGCVLVLKDDGCPFCKHQHVREDRVRSGRVIAAHQRLEGLLQALQHLHMGTCPCYTHAHANDMMSQLEHVFIHTNRSRAVVVNQGLAGWAL